MKKYAVVNLNVAKPNELITKNESNLPRGRILRVSSAIIRDSAIQTKVLVAESFFLARFLIFFWV